MLILLKILIAGIAGTLLMTLFSYLLSKTENEQYREPELLNKLIDRSKNLPSVSDTRTNPIGWIAHFGIGIGFVAAYWLLWPKALDSPTIINVLILGAISGLVGIAAWKIFFTNHDNPPGNNRVGYYGQLFIAHLIFSAVAVLSFKGLEYLF